MTGKATVCQMTYSTTRGGKIGLVFADEADEHTSRSFGYWMPVPVQKLRPGSEKLIDLPRLDLNVIFPCSLNEKYLELTTRFFSRSWSSNGPALVFEIEALSRKVLFELNLSAAPNMIVANRFLSPHNLYSYIGPTKQLVAGDIMFAELMPVDIDEMNDIYTTSKFVFVGQTTRFGDNIKSIFQES